MFDAELVSISNPLALLMGFLSVVQDSNDNVKLFVTAALKYLCVTGLGITVGKYR